MPNGVSCTRSIVGRTAYPTRRVKFTVGIGYPDSIEMARTTNLRVVSSAEAVSQDPGPWAHVEELAGSSVNFMVYFLSDAHQQTVIKTCDRVATAIRLALDEAGIDMPFPHCVLLFHDKTGSRDGDRSTLLPAPRKVRA